MGRARSSPAFNYYTRIKPHTTVLLKSPTVKGFTANNLRGSVRYWNRPPARALGNLPSGSPDGLQMSLRFEAGSGGLPDGSLVSLRLETGPAARSYRFGGWFGFETGPAACPTACATDPSVRWMVRRIGDCHTARATSVSQVRWGKEYAYTPDSPGCGPKPEASRPGQGVDKGDGFILQRSGGFLTPRLVRGWRSGLAHPYVVPSEMKQPSLGFFLSERPTSVRPEFRSFALPLISELRPLRPCGRKSNSGSLTPPPRLLSPLRILPSPSPINCRPACGA
jgi:hypothetical protein